MLEKRIITKILDCYFCGFVADKMSEAEIFITLNFKIAVSIHISQLVYCWLLKHHLQLSMYLSHYADNQNYILQPLKK